MENTIKKNPLFVLLQFTGKMRGKNKVSYCIYKLVIDS